MRETRRNSGGTLISFPSPLSPLPIIIFYINLSSYKTILIGYVIDSFHKTNNALPKSF